MSRIDEIKAKLPKGALEMILKEPSIIDVELNRRKTHHPLKDFVPNIGQERAIKCFVQRHETYNDFPKLMAFFGGNGVGKTCIMVALLAGMTLGVKFLNSQYFDYEYFRECERIRRERPLRIRIVCNKADMEENGSVVQQLKKWLPVAALSGKTSGQYYTTVTVPAPDCHHKKTVIDVKTHDQGVVAHAGPDYDMILFNEPAPADIFGENQGRTRMGGRVAMFLTPLNMAAYLHNVINAEAPPGEVYWTRASIWDNCSDIVGTRGTLARRDIESMIRKWSALNPLEVPAREEGKFMHLVGAVFQSFNPTVHVIDPRPIEPHWEVFHACDPHPHKPHLGVWMARAPMGIWYVIAEYPTQPWEQLTGTSLTIKQFGHEFDRIERGQNPAFWYIKRPLKIKDNFGDPLGMKAEQPNNRKTVQQEYEWKCGRAYNTKVDNDIALRHDALKELVFYDPKAELSSTNTPHIFFFNTVRNSKMAMQEYAYAAKQGFGKGLSDKLEETWKCWIDAIGYIITSVESYRDPSNDSYEPTGDEDFYSNRDPFEPNELVLENHFGERFI